jgi:hypothetical protein
MVYFSCFGMLYQEKSGNPGVVESSWITKTPLKPPLNAKVRGRLN